MQLEDLPDSSGLLLHSISLFETMKTMKYYENNEIDAVCFLPQHVISDSLHGMLSVSANVDTLNKQNT